MLTEAPVPSWSSLFQAFWQRPLSLDELSSIWRREGEVAGWFSRSAWSMARVALWRQQEYPSKNITVWVPDYFCNSSLTPMRSLNAKLIFYPVNHKLEPDYKACKDLGEESPPDLFVLVHYFGCPTIATSTKDFCYKHNAWLLEDAAHVLRPVSGVGKYGDFIIYSPHKLLPIPDGAVLVVRTGGPGQFDSEKIQHFGPNNTWAKDLSLRDTFKRVPVCSSMRYNSEWLLKRIIQKTCIRLKHKFSEFIETGMNEPKDLVFTKPELSPLGRRLLGTLRGSLTDVVRWRQRHHLLWDHLLLERSNLDRLSPASRPQHNEWTPYLTAFVAKDENIAKNTYESLGSQGLPVTTWPDLAPEVCANRERHKSAWRLRHNRFYLPQHQGLRSKDILMAAFELCGENNVSGIGQLKLKLNGTTHEKWNSLMYQVGRSNLLQSWAYGEAKSKTSNWKVRRIVICQCNKPVAFTQILEKRFAFLKLVRVNRGPLFLEDSQPELQEAVTQLLVKELGGWKKGRLLSFAPELPLSGRMLSMMTNLGFYQFTWRRWESIWFDLVEDREELRNRLNGKWRNMLSFSERQNLRLETHCDIQSFEWLVKRCYKMMKDRGESIPSKLYHQLLLEFRSEQPMQVLKAFSEEEPLAGICIVTHGSAATYLLGWNGHKGRSLKANQFLLWNAMMLLKEQGVRWFDLGGIDEESTPGISEFKLGVNGIRYALVGEGWK